MPQERKVASDPVAWRRSEDRVLSGVDALAPGRYVLAVSGGRDSMVVLDAFARVRADAVAVATYDHGTGAHARRAVLLVGLEAGRRGIVAECARRHGEPAADDESAWRRARWSFLGRVAREHHALIVTAHTRDDQIETVVMRVMRDARHTSARGLAGMYAEPHARAVARPLLEISRTDVTNYALLRDVRFLEDPTNASAAHFRNRVRHDLLPALEAARAGFARTMLDLSRRASRWRRDVDALVDTFGGVEVRAGVFAVPALAERAGVALDWRGTERLIAFTRTAKPLRHIPLSGGARVLRTGTTFVIQAGAGGGRGDGIGDPYRLY